MIPDRCSYCRGKLEYGKTEFIARAGDRIIVIKEIPAYVCSQCGEAYFTPEMSRKIDEIMEDFHKGKICCRPVAAGEIEISV